MKKFFYLASAAMLLASCSSESEKAVVENVETQEELQELVEIKLGGSRVSASAETRAAQVVEAWAGTEIGVFAVNELSTAVGGNSWSNATSVLNAKFVASEEPVILFNELATVAGTNGAGPTAIAFDKGTLYYPRTTSKGFGYTFLGYYPYSETVTTDPANPVATANSISVTGKFDGTQDIMAGKAASAEVLATGTPGYTAKYIREYRAEKGGEPTINIPFQHLTSQIALQFKKTNNYQAEYCDVLAAYFEVPSAYSIDFTQDAQDAQELVKVALNFDYANMVNAFATGGDAFDAEKDYVIGDIVYYDANPSDENPGSYFEFSTAHTGDWTDGHVNAYNGVSLENIPADNEYPVFIAPMPQQNSAKSEITLNLVLTDDPSDVKKIAVKSPAGGFLAGKKYVVTVTINGPEAITVTATVVAWEDGGAVDGVEI